MEIPIPVAIILVVLCLIGSAFFSATETAFACLNKYKFQVEAEDGKKASSFVVWFYEHFDTTLITVLVGNNAVAVGVSSIATILLIQLLHSYIDNTTISMISSIAVTILTFLFGDTLPKLIAKKVPNAIARFSVYPIAFFCILFLPVTLVFRGLTFLVRKIFRSEPEPEVQTEDIAEEIERMEKFGDLEANESDILVNSLDFADTSVKEVLTPLRRMKMLDTDGPYLLECAIKEEADVLPMTPPGKSVNEMLLEL